MTGLSSVKEYLSVFDYTEMVEVLIADMNGIWRGKQIPADHGRKIDDGLGFAFATPILTTSGAVSEAIADSLGAEPDRIARVVEKSVVPVPWATRPTVQVCVDMLNPDGSPFTYSPRTVLKNQLDEYAARGLTPVIGIELEFTLFKPGTVPPEHADPVNGQVPSRGENCFTMDMMVDYGTFLADVEAAARQQGLPISGLNVEAGTNQFEINLYHRADAMRVCDEAMLLKRAVRGVALKHGMHASFMAKPLSDNSGSGLHVHFSLLDGDGQNIFASGLDHLPLGYAIAGLLEKMPASTAIFAPNANSYRRFDEEWYAPMVIGWAENNRFLSLRIPPGEGQNRRIEHRAAGADASPHLTVAALLAAALDGMDEKRTTPAPYGEMERPSEDAPRLPARWHSALILFEKDNAFWSRLGKDFCSSYHAIRRREEEDAHRHISRREYEDLLRIL